MKNCQDFQDRLSEYCDGTLSEAERAAFLVHRDGCEACREELDLFEQSLRALDSWQELEPSPTFAARVWEKIRTEPAPRPGVLELLARWFAPSPRSVLGLATLLVLVLGAYLGMQHYQNSQATVEVAVGEVLPEARLADVDVLPEVNYQELAAIQWEDEPSLSGKGQPRVGEMSDPLMEDVDRILEESL